MAAEIKTVYEDDDILVVNKPAGLVVTTEGGTMKGETLQDWLRQKYNNGLPRQGIVHRLDKGTSGLLIIGKTSDSMNQLKKQFKERTVHKKYLAMICGDLPADGEINMPIGRSKYGFGKFAVSVDGKPAWTKFLRLKKYKIKGKIYSLVEVDLKSGRTHQIRVHFSYLRWPLLGDRLYGGDQIDGLDRPFLHSAQITLSHPTLKKEMTLKSDLAPELQQILNEHEEV